MPLHITRAQVRLVDKIAIEEYGIPGIVLMENAARFVTDHAAGLLFARRKAEPSDPEARASVVCGGGNNGGDGLAIARLLHNDGVKTSVWMASDPIHLMGDAAINWKIVEKMNLQRSLILSEEQLDVAHRDWSRSHLLVDAILGTGFSGELRAQTARIVDGINSIHRGSVSIERVPIVAVDLPSGLDCDRGIAARSTVRAELTVTFVAEKLGFSNPAARAFTGRVVVGDIGAPPEILDRVLRECPA